MKKIRFALSLEELKVLNQCVRVSKPLISTSLEKMFMSILIKVEEKLRKRYVSKFHLQDTVTTKLSLEYHEGYALCEYLKQYDLDFTSSPYESNVIMKIKDIIYQQL